MKQINVCLAVFLVTAICPTMALAQWQPPVGIPAPPFGITNLAPARPAVWNTQIPGFYYVDSTVSTSTDTSNTYGTPAKPRQTIPLTLPGGSVVELHGTYSYDHESPRDIVSAGTAAAPVYIRGVSATQKPIVTSCWETNGSYYIIENIEFSNCGSVLFLARTDHGVLRHSDVHGNLSGGGVGVLSWNGQTTSDVVLWDNLIHDNGDVHATYDQDVHGIAVSSNVNHLWVVDNQIYRNSGDGIQINAGSAALQPTTHHIYVGRNISHDNKQTGFWTKQAVDVIFSQNEAYSHHPSNSSMGACMGGQYAPDHVWFIDNAMWDCDYGIQLASDNGLGSGVNQFFIGNLIAFIHTSTGIFQSGSAWQNCGIGLPGGTNRYVMENSMYDVDSGVCVPGSNGVLYMFDNLIEKVRSDGYHVMFDSPVFAKPSNYGGNIFAPGYRLGIGGSTQVSPPTPLGAVGANGSVSTISYVNPAAGDLHLNANSPAAGFGMMNQTGIWSYFQSRYGVSLAIDAYGVRRDTVKAPDSGAVQH